MQSESLKRTPLYENHIRHGAKMVGFAGWDMPVQYTNIVEEHLTVRKNVGLFDVSHMGNFFVKGKNSFKFLQSLVPNDLSVLPEGKAIYSQLCNPNGGTVDDLIIYYLKQDDYIVVVNASNLEKDFNWIKSHLIEDVTLEDHSDEISLLALQGPMAVKLLSPMCSDEISSMPSFGVKKTKIGNVPVTIARTGYTGEDGFEIFISNNEAPALWERLLEEGKEYEIKPIGLGARDTLRLESNLPLYGHELDSETSPLEARLGWSVKLEKDSDFIGKDVLIKQKQEGLKKKLIGIKSLSKAIPRDGYDVLYEGEVIGKITSGTVSPLLNYPIALAFVDTKRDYKIGDKLEVVIRKQNHPVEIVKLPFYKRNRSI